jgi:hypothetical protein
MPKNRLTRAEMIQRVMNSFEPNFSKLSSYSYVTLLGHFPLSPIVDDLVIEMKPGVYNGLIEKMLYNRINELAGDYVITKNTKKTLDVSVRKFDMKPCYDFRQDPYYSLAVEILAEKNAGALLQDSMSIEEIMQALDWKKSAGFVAGYNGYKTKHHWMTAGYLREIYDYESLIKEVPIWKVAGKQEPEERTVYTREYKQRTFIIEPVETLWHTKRLWGNQNEGLKQYWWSAYGMDPYEGGVQRMALRLLRYKRYWELDGKRWDRMAAWMQEVYLVRNTFIKGDPLKDWLTVNKISTHCVLPNGDYIFKDWGNNSGSGNTTGDNIMGMELVLIHAMLRLGNGDRQFVEEMWARCFGDDVLAGDNLNCSDEELRQSIEETFKLYGVELDPFIITHSLEGMSFLGFKLKEIIGGWIPVYDLGRLAKSFLFETHTTTPEGNINRMLSILLMVAGNGETIYNMFREAFMDVLCNAQIELTKKLLRVGVPTYDEVISWYLGTESKSHFFFFLNEIQESLITCLRDEGWSTNDL